MIETAAATAATAATIASPSSTNSGNAATASAANSVSATSASSASSSSSTPPTTNTTTSTSTSTSTSPSTSTSTSTTSSTPSKIKDASNCQACVKLVSEILNNPHSRPRQVIHALLHGAASQANLPAAKAESRHPQPQSYQQQSLTHHQRVDQEQPSFQLKPVHDGVEVVMRLPELPFVLPKRWTQVTPTQDEDEDDTTRKSFLTPVLATSASAMEETNSNTPNNSHKNHTTAATTKFLTETIKIECRPCATTGPEQGARALIMGPTPLSIVACTNRLTPNDQEEMDQVLTHELLHAYDVKQLHLNFSDCESMAYSEVRAAREAECSISSSHFGNASSTTATGGWASPAAFLKQYCVKQKAIAATHNLFPRQGRNCVRTVFNKAYADPRPFHLSSQNTAAILTHHQQQKQQQHLQHLQSFVQNENNSAHSATTANTHYNHTYYEDSNAPSSK